MAKADKKTRGRTSITGKSTSLSADLGPKKSHPMTKQDQLTTANRPQGAGGGNKHRGDRRDMNKTYTGNVKHAARGKTGRPNVATSKD
jgi:hypothetical protein